MKIAFYAAFATMVLGAITVILAVPALFTDPSALKEGLVIWAGTASLAGFSVVKLLKNAVLKEA
jgi:hypothetical protein